MWYEIIPCAGIMVGLMCVPNMFNWGLNKFTKNGKTCARYWEAGQRDDMYSYLRDRRITGSEYVPRGLEAIPDLK